MTFEEHDDKVCDRCQEHPKKWRLPFLFKDMDDKSHKDLGDGYRQYYVCDKCKEFTERLFDKQQKEEIIK